MNEYRPRIRVNRKKPVSRKGKYILTVCQTEDDAIAVEAFLLSMFEAARRDHEKAKSIMEQQRLDAQITALVGAEVVEVGEAPAEEVVSEPSEDE